MCESAGHNRFQTVFMQILFLQFFICELFFFSFFYGDFFTGQCKLCGQVCLKRVLHGGVSLFAGIFF